MYPIDFKNSTNHPILKKYEQINQSFNDDRTVVVCYDDHRNEFYLQEGCDDYYEHTLTKEDCITLSNLFKELSEVIQ